MSGIGWDDYDDCPLWQFTEEELAEHDAEVRVDAIDECIKKIDKLFLYTDNRGIDRYASYSQINRNSIHSMLEQLKEQK